MSGDALGRRRIFRPERADANGLVALGGTLEPELILEAYASGVFPWSDQPVLNWWSPDPRAIFDLQTWRPHRSVRRSMARAGWRYSVDEAFPQVIRACAEETAARPGTWISPAFIAAYEALHRAGHVHSVEVWQGEELVGGLYGVTLGGLFGGESMFHRRTDASKAAVAYLVERLRARGFQLLDGQAPNEHLHALGAITISRAEYLERLQAALRLDVRFA